MLQKLLINKKKTSWWKNYTNIRRILCWTAWNVNYKISCSFKLISCLYWTEYISCLGKYSEHIPTSYYLQALTWRILLQGWDKYRDSKTAVFILEMFNHIYGGMPCIIWNNLRKTSEQINEYGIDTFVFLATHYESYLSWHPRATILPLTLRVFLRWCIKCSKTRRY